MFTFVEMSYYHLHNGITLAPGLNNKQWRPDQHTGFTVSLILKKYMRVSACL